MWRWVGLVASGLVSGGLRETEVTGVLLREPYEQWGLATAGRLTARICCSVATHRRHRRQSVCRRFLLGLFIHVAMVVVMTLLGMTIIHSFVPLEARGVHGVGPATGKKY